MAHHPRKFLRLTLLAALAILMPCIAAAQSPTYKIIYSFHGSPDGGDPRAALVISKSGALYGSTASGGASGWGTVFEMTKPTGEPWKETVLFSFNLSDGLHPWSPLVFGSRGALYGVTAGGGGEGSTGVVFELAPPSAAGGAWTETVLYAFTGSLQNAAPNGPLLFGPGGTLYTTTEGTGGPQLGQVVALVPPTTAGGAWTESVLYPFGGPPGGEYPVAGVVSEGGSLFGTTDYGGDGGCNFPYGCGIAYELTPPTAPGDAWTETTLHTFPGPPSDGAEPEAPLAIGPGGVLYGTTYFGGPNVCADSLGTEFGCGTVFQLTPPSAPSGTWAYSVIYNFTGVDGDGALPAAGVVVGKNGAIYGTTSSRGSSASESACRATYLSSGCGIVFELTPPSAPGGAWTETILHSFSGENGDGAIPLAGLALSSSGVLYGTTAAGGTAGNGTVFAIEP